MNQKDRSFVSVRLRHYSGAIFIWVWLLPVILHPGTAHGCDYWHCQDIDRFFAPLMANGVYAAADPSPLQPAPHPQVALPPDATPGDQPLGDQPIVIRVAPRPARREERHLGQVEIYLYPGSLLDDGGIGIRVTHPVPALLRATAPWVIDSPDFFGVSGDGGISGDGTPSPLAAPFLQVEPITTFKALISHPLHRTLAWPLQQPSTISLLCARCLGAALSRLSGRGQLVLRSGATLSGGMEDMQLAGKDGTATGSFSFAKTNINAPLATSSLANLNLDFGGGAQVFDGNIVLWQPAPATVAGVLAVMPQDIFSKHGAVLVYFSPDH